MKMVSRFNLTYKLFLEYEIIALNIFKVAKEKFLFTLNSKRIECSRYH